MQLQWEESIIKKFFPEEISNLNEINLKTLYEEKKKIELNENSHLYDEMIESVGDEILVKVTEIDSQGRINLSRKDALPQDEVTE